MIMTKFMLTEKKGLVHFTSLVRSRVLGTNHFYEKITSFLKHPCNQNLKQPCLETVKAISFFRPLTRCLTRHKTYITIPISLAIS